MKVYWEAFQHVNGTITLEKDLLFADRTPENLNSFVFKVRSGFLEGEFRVSEAELRALQTFLKNHLRPEKCYVWGVEKKIKENSS